MRRKIVFVTLCSILIVFFQCNSSRSKSKPQTFNETQSEAVEQKTQENQQLATQIEQRDAQIEQLVAQNQQNGATIKQQETELKLKDTEIENRDLKIQKKDAEIRLLITQNQQQQDPQIQQLAAQVQQKETELQRQVVQAQQKDTELQRQIVQNRQKDSLINHHVAQVRQKDTELQRQIAQNRQKDSLTNHHIALIRQKDSLISHHTAQNRQKDSELQRQIAQNRQKDSLINHHVAQIQQKDTELQRQIAQNRQKDTLTQQLTARIDQKDKQITQLDAIKNDYKSKKFDELVKSSTPFSIQSHLSLVGSDAGVKPVLDDLNRYFNAQELLSRKYDAGTISNAQRQLNQIKRESKLVGDLKDNLSKYKEFNDPLKRTVAKIVNEIDKPANMAGSADTAKRGKFSDIMKELNEYIYNNPSYVNYPHLSRIVFDIMQRKSLNPDESIRDLLQKL